MSMSKEHEKAEHEKKGEQTKQDSKTCFIVTPIGDNAMDPR